MKIANVLLIVGGLAFVSSCGNGKSMGESDAGQNKDVEFSVDTVEWSDSVVVGDRASVVSAIAVYPIMKSNATDSINAWISQCLMPKSNVSGSIVDVVKKAGESAIDSIKSDFSSLEKDGFDNPMPEEYKWNIGPDHVGSKYVTYKSVSYVYQGGAHGASIYAASTFGLPSGKVWGYNMLNASDLAKVRALVIEGLQTYFKVDSVGALKENLLVGPDEVTLPQTPPCLTVSGMEFVYQQYEIAPYAAGMPKCVVPYSAIEQYMVPEARELLK